jgi:PadR family transcriptional regulator PadR
MKFTSELLKGSTKNLILSAVSRKEMYGYEIVKEIRDVSEDIITLGEGSMYPALHELEKLGYLSSHWVEQNGAPDRKYYKITRKGRKVLKTALGEWKVFTKAVNQIYGIAR